MSANFSSASALVLLTSLLVLQISTSAESPVPAPSGTVDTRLLAKAVLPVPTNGVSALTDPARVSHTDKLSADELLLLLTAELQPRQVGDKLELRLTREWKPVPIPSGSIDLRILDKPVAGLSSHLLVRFELLSGGKPLGIFSTFVQARLLREVWIAPSTLGRGKRLDEVDLRQEQRDVINLREPNWSRDNFDPSFHTSDFYLAESVPAGAIIFARHVKLRPVMKRGDQVQAIIKDDFMSVSVKVEVLSDGAPGDLVRARNLRTKKEIRGKVLDEDTIQVLHN